MIKKYPRQEIRRSVRTRARILRGSKIGFKLTVNKSNKYIAAQLINLQTGKTITSVKSKEAEKVGKIIAEKAKKEKVERIIFDRGAYKYHGNIKTLAEAARKGGLKF